MANASAWSTSGPPPPPEAPLAPLVPLAQGLNSTQLGEITMDTNFALLLLSLAAGALWVIYITYYNSRVIGYILTRLINRFYFQDENFKIGSLTLSALAGKIMFRDLVYVTYDYSLRVQDGYLIFRWWRSYMPKDVSEDLSHSDTRLSIVLNGFELHFYNRCELYNELEKSFGLEGGMKAGGEAQAEAEAEAGAGAGQRERAMNEANEKRRRARSAARSEAALARTWRDLIPVIKLDVSCGRVVFGNRLVPTTLALSAEEAHLVYSTKPPASSLDHLMHFVKAEADNCKVMLAPSPSYTAMVDEPPRYMGEGFVVMSSNRMEVYFYMDEPGLVPPRPVLLQLANGDVVESAPPVWGVDVKCGKGTDFSYGPWADRQRDHLFKFFFPPSYKNLEVTPAPKPGDRRQVQSFDIRLSTLNEATIDILFTKNKETNAVHINIGAGSYLEVTLPWSVPPEGCATRLAGQLLHVEATTSLAYRSLAESETLEFALRVHYPLVWNHAQCWQLALTGCKATAHLVYAHVDFFQDLVEDWATKARPDILHFVPYTWKISLLLKECEVLTVSNKYNWIDCSSTNQENNHVAFCGDLLDVSFDLPFVDFLPDVIPLKIWVQGEAVDMSLYLPEVNTSRLLLLSIDKNMKLVPCRLRASKWRRKCVKSQGWVDCWSVPIVALSVRYAYHPVPPLGPAPQADITTPEKEEILLSPMRIPRIRKQPQINWAMDGNDFDRTTLAPDKVSVELEVGPSVLLAYGTIITSFMNLLENIFGEDQTFTDMQKTPNMDAFTWMTENSSRTNEKGGLDRSDIAMDDSSESSADAFDPRRCRPLEVTVSITIHDIQAHLVKNCSENEPPCPVVLIERFGFEMDKSFRETKLQLLLSPSRLVSASAEPRAGGGGGGGAAPPGHLLLSSLQLRGHGMFSDARRAADQDTVEYAWLLELQLGQLTGRLAPPQLFQVAAALETFLLLLCDDENEPCPPSPAERCHHGVDAALCADSDPAATYLCPASDEIKYKMIRVAIDLIDVHVADSGTSLQTRLSPVRLSVCNLYGSGCGSGATALLPSVKLVLYTQNNMQGSAHHHSSGSGSSQSRPPDGDAWLGVGSLSLGPVLVEAADALPQTPRNMHSVQQKFLRLHDEKTKRLRFLWPGEGGGGQCACVGGCAFFGSNRNGPNFFKPNASDLREGVNVAMFNVMEGAAGEYGYGQSLLHPGQLVFHTPPYSGLNVCLQPTRAPAPSPQPPAPAPAHCPAERRSLPRRFSYSSAGKGGRGDVPYARLLDAAAPLAASKIDSDSKLNETALGVPQLESSVSDSRLALSCGIEGSDESPPSESDAFAVPKVLARPAVGASESHYSLNSHPPRGDAASAEVQRTISITSENHSEAFFSADEDVFPSRSSSLKYSFGSRHSAHKDKSSFGINEVTNEKWTNSLSKPNAADAPDTVSNLSTGAQPDSESGSVSSTSFISAISSQEDMTLVNLHMQTNKPIVDSPLLMSSYSHHLTQYRCANWAGCSLPAGGDAFTVPLFKRADDGTLVYVGQKYLPNFEPIGRVNAYKLIPKKDEHGHGQHGPCGNATAHFNSQVKGHPFPASWWDELQGAPDGREGADAGAGGAAGGAEPAGAAEERTGVCVRVRGDVEAMLTPLVLESAQKFAESLTGVVGGVHPVTVVGHLRRACAAAVRRANALKRRRLAVHWLPQMEARARAQPPAAASAHVYERAVGARLQLAVLAPRLCLALVQSSVVEDVISFSALDDLQELTCVSLFGACVEGAGARLASARRSLESVQLYYRPALRALAAKKSFGIMKGPRALAAHGSARKRGPDKGEPVYIETSQHQSEDTTFTLNVGKVHGQLRRIRNESSQLKDAIITGIPCQHSKVAFKFVKMEQCSRGCDPSAACCHNGASEGSLGYIMFECGLEGAAVKVARHAHSQPPAPEPEPEPQPDLLRRREPASKPPTPGPATPPPAPAPAPPADDAALVARAPPAGDATSCSVDLKVVWFNFAAPPRTPITRKIDYTRLDWNLLSTASPAISAWLNPANRLALRGAALLRAARRRLTATAAALMAGALDLPALHTAPKSRYGRYTAMARQLREEPSLQLCAVLVRHALQADAAALQADLAERHLPALAATAQGVVVLARQWKNILYTPLLLEHNYKSRAPRPLNVTFALPRPAEAAAAAAEAWAEGAGALDESCLLLDMDADTDADADAAAAARGGAGGGGGGGRPHSFPSTPPSGRGTAPRGSLALPPLPLPFVRRAAAPQPPPPPPHPAGDATAGLAEGGAALGSSGSLYSRASDEALAHAQAQAARHERHERAREDLYQWMAKQEPVRTEPKKKKPMIPAAKMHPPPAPAALPACSVYPLGGALMLLDAQLVFQPLLAALGVSPRPLPHEGAASGEGAGGEGEGEAGAERHAPALESLGSRLALVVWVDAFRIHIAVSELGARERPRGAAPAAAGGEDPPPAFLCERVSLEAELRKVADVAADELVRRRNVLYISRSQLKRRAATVLHLNLAVRFVAQQVNMPLLRLLHQITNMYQNVKDAQSELRAHAAPPRAGHTSSSVSDYRENLVSVSSLERDPPLAGAPDARWEAAGADLPPEPPPPPAAPPTPAPASAAPPAPRAKPRPQSLAQKLRSTGKSVKGKLGYSSLTEAAHTPVLAADQPAGAAGAAGAADSLAALAGPAAEADKMVPRCWRTMYLLLDLYAHMPDSETITHRFSVSTELPEQWRASRRPAREPAPPAPAAPPPPAGIVVVGVARIHRTRLLASLSGLKLEAEMTSLQGSLSASRARQWALTGTLARAAIVLLEGPPPAHQTVVRVSVGKSQALHSWEAGRAGCAAALLSVGGVRVELPQHPVALHGVMTRSSRQLSSTLQELGVTRAPSRPQRAPPAAVPAPPPRPPRPPRPPPPRVDALLNPVHLQFSIAVQSLSVTAALLPSLQAQYKMEAVQCGGVWGPRAHFTAELGSHSLSFVTRLPPGAPLPAAAAVALPPVHVAAHVRDQPPEPGPAPAPPPAGPAPARPVLRAGRYLHATADIGHFEHTLSTDLLNHLVLVQKVFMKEVNEVVQKVYGGEKPVPLWGEEPAGGAGSARLLFSLTIRIKRIQLTATTPSSSAVRLETGAVHFELSNRVQNVSPHDLRLFARAQVDVNLSLGQLIRNAMFEEAEPEFLQYAFFNTRISMRNALQEETAGAGGEAGGEAGAAGEGGEAEAEADAEVVVITLVRPLVYVQPVAVDRAVLVWLNYKSAYDYWSLQRATLHHEVTQATHHLVEKVQLAASSLPAPASTLFVQLNVDDIGICLPLNQPPAAGAGGAGVGAAGSAAAAGAEDGEGRGAVVVTLESTSVSACSARALVSKGRFVGLCVRFASDFEASLDDWRPRADECTLNVCCVSEGTYEVCSRTAAARGDENAKWFLNVSWQMEGVDIHLDVSVGQQLSALGHTLTMLTGFEEEEPWSRAEGGDESEPDDDAGGSRGSQESVVVMRRRGGGAGGAGGASGAGAGAALPAGALDPALDARARSRLIEHEMSEQARIVADLRALGASHHTVELELRRLHDLEALLYRDFRRDMLQKLRRQSVKASSITKGKLGLGSNRSRSFAAPPAPAPPAPAPPVSPRAGASTPSEAEVEASYSASDSGELLLGEERLADIAETASWGSADSLRAPTPGSAARSRSLRGCRRSPPPVQRQASLPAPPPPPQHPRPHTLATGEGVAGAAGAAGGMGGAGGAAGAAERKAGGEPNVDLELDVKVLVSSGKCVLHTKDPPPPAHHHDRDRDRDDTRGAWRTRVGRSASGGLAEGGSAGAGAGAGVAGAGAGVAGAAGAGGSPGSRRKARAHPAAADLTVFRVPGLHLKVHYDSKTLPEEAAGAGGAGRKAGAGGNKKAALLAWITLQSIPEETLISPHILDFLEQALEPIPLKTFQPPTPEAESGAAEGAGGGGAGGGEGADATYAYASFPVDVIVHFHMQPSAFRFSCLPASRVECLLHLPSLQMVFSSKRAEEAWEGCGAGAAAGAGGVAHGGLSVTGCLADFSVYVFHPYGHHQHPQPTTTPQPPAHNLKDQTQPQPAGGAAGAAGAAGAGGAHASRSPLGDSQRKDSLSIDVEFVKFHLSRSRKLQLQPDPDRSKATVRFSTIVDVGAAWFKYDMRRLGEILAFPKAWYRRTIVRRVFLGDLSVPPDRQPPATPASASGAAPLSPALPQRERAKTEKQKAEGDAGAAGAAWETLVLFAVNFTRLNVHMNMGNVMGNVSWQSRDFNCSGRLSIGSSGHRRMLLAVALARSALDARGGIVGGAICLSAIHTYVYVEEEGGGGGEGGGGEGGGGGVPEHVCGVRLAALELRLEYMGTAALLARVSRLAAAARDQCAPPAPHRPGMVLAHASLAWQQLQLVLSRSTTPDLLKMQLKLEEFFTQQFKSSKRVLSALHPAYGARRPPPPAPAASAQGASGASPAEGLHWLRVLRRLPRLDGTVVGGTMELAGRHVSLACFHGASFKAKSWALFSLRDPCVSFTTEAQLPPPTGTDGAEQQAVQVQVQVVQSLTASLGGAGGGEGAGAAASAGHQSQATVCRMTRAVLFPPQFKTLREWFHYAFASSEIDAIELFPSLEREGSGSNSNSNSVERGASGAGGAGSAGAGGGKAGGAGGAGAAHTREVIFALPALQLHLRTTQRLPLPAAPAPAPRAPHSPRAARAPHAGDGAADSQAEGGGGGGGGDAARPAVECSFITEFEDHIFVSVDAEAFLFLHDLISSYLKEKDRVLPTASRGSWGEGAGGTSGTGAGGRGGGTHDERDYRCHTWHLEPTVRLLSWAGKSIEPYGVDYILQKLGFRHARTTIPKWLQRGALDPLDALLARLAALLPPPPAPR